MNISRQTDVHSCFYITYKEGAGGIMMDMCLFNDDLGLKDYRASVLDEYIWPEH